MQFLFYVILIFYIHWLKYVKCSDLVCIFGKAYIFRSKIALLSRGLYKKQKLCKPATRTNGHDLNKISIYCSLENIGFYKCWNTMLACVV